MSSDPDFCAPTPSQTSRTPRVITPPLPPGSCSAYTDEELAGTAAHEKLWVLLEHPGNWGRDIFDGHAFDEETSDQLRQQMKEAGARLLLIRRPGRTGQLAKTAGKLRVFIADSVKNQLFTFTVKEPADLLKVNLQNPRLIPSVRASSQVLTLICTHAKRDRCCALRGRPLAAYLAAKRPADTVWECSHTGGHRFAPVGLLMPSGYTYGRLTAESTLAAVEFLEDRNYPSLEGLRGRSSLTAPEQAAEVFVRRSLENAGEVAGIDELTVKASANKMGATVTHKDGRSWDIQLTKKQLAPRPNSCGKDAGSAFSWKEA